MKDIHLKSVFILAILVWTLGVISFITSYFVPMMSDPDIQANWFLAIFFIPAATFGAHIYYRKGYKTNGIVLGALMFLVTIILDAFITVPFFIMPYGGNYASFFLDPGFWLLAVEYISVVVAYWQIEKAVKRTRVRKASLDPLEKALKP